MKITVIFDQIKILTPVDGKLTIQELAEKALVRYKRYKQSQNQKIVNFFNSTACIPDKLTRFDDTLATSEFNLSKTLVKEKQENSRESAVASGLSKSAEICLCYKNLTIKTLKTKNDAFLDFYDQIDDVLENNEEILAICGYLDSLTNLSLVCPVHGIRKRDKVSFRNTELITPSTDSGAEIGPGLLAVNSFNSSILSNRNLNLSKSTPNISKLTLNQSRRVNIVDPNSSSSSVYDEDVTITSDEYLKNYSRNDFNKNYRSTVHYGEKNRPALPLKPPANYGMEGAQVFKSKKIWSQLGAVQCWVNYALA